MVFQFHRAPATFDAFFQASSELVLLRYGLDDSNFALFQLFELRVLLADFGDLHLVEVTCSLFAVAGNERNGASLIEQF